jgi:hypothetical protein
MKGSRLVGVVLLAAGILALAYGGFTYTKDTDKAKLGPIELTVKDREHVNIPVWAGVLSAIVGGILLARRD